MSDKNISYDNIDRYDRQMKLPAIGPEGQKKLSMSRVLVVGAGGLGSPVLQYLAGAGVGTIGIVDTDTVSITNLHRQVLHPESHVGMNKAESAAIILRKQNSSITINTHPFMLDNSNANEIISCYDFIIDAVDNFETKFLINRTCVYLKKAFCYAGVIQFHGQLMTYVPGQGPCLRCIFEDDPAPADVPKCSQVGVLGQVAGVIGCLEAIEAIKYITGAGQLLIGRMLIFDGLSSTIRVAKFSHARVGCEVCNQFFKD